MCSALGSEGSTGSLGRKEEIVRRGPGTIPEISGYTGSKVLPLKILVLYELCCYICLDKYPIIINLSSLGLLKFYPQSGYFGGED